MVKDQYVIMTGAKNNAGDFLIKRQAIDVLTRLRPDRKLVLQDAWRSCDETKIKTINESRALILTGGPSLQKNMYPGIYPLVNDLEKITAPIILMGVGWKSQKGQWSDTRSYSFNKSSKLLLKKISEAPYISSVRDYHSQNALNYHGLNNVITTGCPALFETREFEEKNAELQKIGFSLGVTFLKSKRMELQAKEIISGLQKSFPGTNLVVAFHHSLSNDFLKTHGATSHHLESHQTFAGWLDQNDIPYKDVSGSAEAMAEFYASTDLHIGYRVHAHIHMTSLNRRTILLAEDGRGLALKDVIGSSVINAVEQVDTGMLGKVCTKAFTYDQYNPSRQIASEVIRTVKEEIKTGFTRSKIAHSATKHLWQKMEYFCEQLP